MKKTLQYLKNRKTKPDTKLYKEDTDTVIEYKERYILAFEYIKKSFNRFHYDFNEYRDI